MRRALVVAMLASLATVGGGWEARACSCDALTPAAALKGADVAFTGLVTAVVDGPAATDPRTVTVDVDDVYKGTVYEVTTLETEADADACGIDFVPSRRYTVFANREGARLSSGLCSGTSTDTGLLDDVAPAKAPLAIGATPAPQQRSRVVPFLTVLAGIVAAGAITAWRRRRATHR